MVANVITKIAEDTAISALEKIKKFFKGIDAQDAIRYGTAFDDYLRNTKNKYSKIKTLIYRHSPKDINKLVITIPHTDFLKKSIC